MERDSILQKLKQFVIEQSNLEDASFLQSDTELFEAGLLDSLMTVSLVSFCEEQFDCQMDIDELSQDNFRTLNALTDFISRKLEAKMRG